MNLDRLLLKIGSLSAEQKRERPLPMEWIEGIAHSELLRLLDSKILGMDGFQYCFDEYAKECWRRCHRVSL